VAIDKPAGQTSRQVVDRVAKLVRPAKAGHAGTLDPLATGVLVVAIGAATRLISYIQQSRKRYVGQFRLGQRSNTDDIEGELTAGGDWSGITEAQLTEATGQFVGRVSQVPPQFSAIHVQGQRAYAMARRGEEVTLAARPVEIYSIRVTRFAPPEFELEVECGAGTYIRSIGRDLGNMLGCGALMTGLCRESVGAFTIESAMPFDRIDKANLRDCLQSPLMAIADMPKQTIDSAQIRALFQGKTIQTMAMEGVRAGTEVALVDAGETLLGIGRIEESPVRIQPQMMFPEQLSQLQPQ
jgi:tRNA pseudouridine55 synthase